MPFVPKRWIVIPNCLIIIAVVVKFEAMYITSGLNLFFRADTARSINFGVGRTFVLETETNTVETNTVGIAGAR